MVCSRGVLVSLRNASAFLPKAEPESVFRKRVGRAQPTTMPRLIFSCTMATASI